MSSDRRGDTGFGLHLTVRQGAKSVTHSKIMPGAAEHENKGVICRTALEDANLVEPAEGAKREFAVPDAKVSPARRQGQKLHCVQVDDKFKPIAGTGIRTSRRSLVLLAMGFVHPVHEGMLKKLGVDLDQRGNVAPTRMTTRPRCPRVLRRRHGRGQSLVVWAIREGRPCARAIDQYLMGSTTLPR